MTDILRMVSALVFVLALIGLAAWLMRRFGPTMRLGRAGRLGLVETIAIDSRRRLILIRRDNVEHLVMIGGTGDLVIESGINSVAESPPPTSLRRSEPSFAAHLPGNNA
jgi:flagellar protein FliO/FliZ